VADKTPNKPEIASQKRVIKLTPAIGDWTTYRPPKVLIKRVKSGLYGFDRLSREDLALGLKVHYNFVSRLLDRLKVELGIGVEFLSCQAEQTTYLNFLRSLAGQVVQCQLNLAEINDGIQLFCGLEIANSLINHALGSHDTEALNRALTEAEKEVFTAALTEYLAEYRTAFLSAISEPSFRLVSAPEITLDQSVNPSAAFIAFTAEVILNDNQPARIVFGYPGSALKTLLRAYKEKEAEQPLNFGRLPAALLNRLAIKVEGLLGFTALHTSELHRLEVGDVVSLDTPINAPVTLVIGRKLKLPGQPGTRNKKKSVRIAALGENAAVELTPPFAPAEEVKAPPPAPVKPPPAPAQPAPELPSEDIFAEEPLADDDFSAADLELEDFNLDSETKEA